MQSNAVLFPSMQANGPFDASTVAYAFNQGINSVELDALAQAISRLGRDHSTVVVASMKTDLQEFEDLGYITLTPTSSGTLSVDLICAGALLSNYFWAVWVPRYLNNCSLKVSVMAHLEPRAEVQHCTVVFRIPGPRETTGAFLTELGTKFPGHEPEIIAIQVGNRLEQEGLADE
ncbi:hypothetical protein [Pseudomonas chlororaphis]|uniref:Hyphothetical protein CP11 n=1 Tax=Pseudomonas chlororaphis TaxID=587753 RepID=A0AAX3FTC3_9PSED|nr:hypothetical protein [Pseudomonas chlororaphis]AZC39391.1 hypothetical protein C4K37_5026 [Pseudomonas chlororaphis subsp. piscium]AZC45942.1 hypothetical protein C4K36_5039 [Pseudomonas chlororaphis subsp. piscium]WDG71475.1 hypothetical protein PUP65_25720 [Pseudomonas chlororaphis]WDH30741.1 hypothetical protein PUP81_08600 [Pseudomonas chlororaphis]WDH70001.1 hypothetical protein PUP78_25705 [Pseudomonas chlororaphis]